MPRFENGKEFLNGDEVMEFWPASKNLFYGNIQPRLKSYHFDGKKRPHYYEKSEVLALKSGEPIIHREPITISGIFGDWTYHLRSRGYQATTIDKAIEQTTLPEEVKNTFHIPADRQFIKRSRMTLANGAPICTWSTYYPLELVEGTIFEEMKRDSTTNVVKRIQEEHGFIARWEKNRYTARSTTLEEQKTLELLTNEPVLILQRGCWTDDRQILTHISHMTLLASWFAIEHDAPIATATWENQKEKEV